MVPRPTTLPTLDATPRPLTIRVAPLADAEVGDWARLPAVSTLAAADFHAAKGTARFTVQVASVARLQAQLRHLADRVQASFEPAVDGALSLRLRPATATSRAWERVAAYRAALTRAAPPAAALTSA